MRPPLSSPPETGTKLPDRRVEGKPQGAAALHARALWAFVRYAQKRSTEEVNDMQEDEARAIIEEHAEQGGRIVPALQADLRAIKSLYSQCLDADVPALLGPCAGGG
jgi:hypothetical protein